MRTYHAHACSFPGHRIVWNLPLVGWLLFVFYSIVLQYQYHLRACCFFVFLRSFSGSVVVVGTRLFRFNLHPSLHPL